jgi:protein-glutamine gamma-glutamyltransferase
LRFSAIHKAASYLMVACAYAALAFSGELSVSVVVPGAILVALSWFFEPPRFRPERWTVWWNVAAVAAFGYTILSFFSGAEWVVSGANLLVFLVVAKLFNRKSSRDYQVVYVLSFLMLVAGTTLNADLSYAVFFLGYAVFATWALILFHLRREMEDNFLLKHSDDSSSERVEVERILNSRRIVGPSFLAATSSVSLLIFFGSALMFFLFPRVGFGLFFQKSRTHLTFAGFQDGVTLGGHGLIRNDDTIVMRVKVSERRYQGPAAPELHWRGAAYDRYSEGKWSRSPTAFGTRGRPGTAGNTTRIQLDAAARYPDWPQTALRQEIYLEPLDTASLFAASTPLAFELENVLPGTAASMHGRYGQNDEIRYSHNAGLRYVAYSEPRMPREDELEAAGDADAAVWRNYLEIPPEMPPRVRELAARIVEGKRGPHQKAEAVLRYLRANYGYTLEMATDDAREPLDYFLFDRKQGHCEYFSSAMAILLRAAGVPTRNVNGFLGGEWNEYGGYVAVRGGDAHSWIEVWFDGVGWVSYDPTPAAAATSLARGGGGLGGRLRRMLDTLRLAWFKWVIEFDLGSQLGLLKRVGSVLSFGGHVSARAAGAWLKAHRLAVGGGAAGVAGLWLAAVLLRRRRRRQRAAISDDEAFRLSHPVLLLYARTARMLARRGHPRAASQTPREHAVALRAQGVAGATPFAELTELYYTARYSGAQAVDVAAAERLVAAVDQEVRRGAGAAKLSAWPRAQ